MLQNYTEIIVDDVLSNMLRAQELECQCEKCMDDIRAIALNNLEPKYVATERGILYSKLNEFSVQAKADVIRELTKAMEKVKENPRHNKVN